MLEGGANRITAPVDVHAGQDDQLLAYICCKWTCLSCKTKVCKDLAGLQGTKFSLLSRHHKETTGVVGLSCDSLRYSGLALANNTQTSPHC